MKNKYMEDNKQEMLSFYLMMFVFPRELVFKALAAVILEEKDSADRRGSVHVIRGDRLEQQKDGLRWI